MTTIHYEKNWRWKQHVNQVGATVTAIVFVVLVATKFLEGAWIVALVIPPLLVYIFDRIHVHYEQVAAALSTSTMQESELIEVANVVIVPIADVHKGTLLALQYAKRLSNDVRAVCISTSPKMRERVTSRWARFPKLTEGIKLDIIDYDYRDILKPLEDYIAHVNRVEFPDQLVTVVVPEFVSPELAAQWLHNQTATILRARLHHYEGHCGDQRAIPHHRRERRSRSIRERAARTLRRQTSEVFGNFGSLFRGNGHHAP
ncbi:MAG: hypothetical protein M5U29_08520 [Anaerolineae bacterium]|nr:hypothetical protein [Anaerolineae bacterium]